jgi:RNA polymerase sigma-70 factor (ECF subfamily)
MSAAKWNGLRVAPIGDGALLTRVAQGDSAALGALYDRYALHLLRFARRLEPQEADDIVQTTFMRVLRLAASFDPETPSARAWLFAITAHVVQERRRTMRRWTAALLRLADQPLRAAPAIADTRPDLARALARLSPAKRTVLVLAEVEGFACDEIAAMLSIPVGTVWTRLYHARRELRRYHREEGV